MSGYRPISLSLIAADNVNGQPSSENPLNNASGSTQPYRTTETRLQLSVRTKLAQGLLTGDGPRRDSLWFGYTQQSYWQVFTAPISRPFRSTDHEPEFVYVYPSTLDLPAGLARCATRAWAWCTSRTAKACRCRAAGTGSYLMAGAEQRRGASPCKAGSGIVSTEDAAQR